VAGKRTLKALMRKRQRGLREHWEADPHKGNPNTAAGRIKADGEKLSCSMIRRGKNWERPQCGEAKRVTTEERRGKGKDC